MSKPKSYFTMKVEMEHEVEKLKDQLKEIKEKQKVTSNKNELITLQYRRTKLSEYIRTIATQLDHIGSRKGEQIDHEEWMNDLPITAYQKKMFIRIYQDRWSFTKCAEEFETDVEETKEIFRLVEKIAKEAIRNRLNHNQRLSSK